MRRYSSVRERERERERKRKAGGEQSSWWGMDGSSRAHLGLFEQRAERLEGFVTVARIVGEVASQLLHDSQHQRAGLAW